VIDKAGLEVEQAPVITPTPVIIPVIQDDEDDEPTEQDVEDEEEDEPEHKTINRYDKPVNSNIGYRFNPDSIGFGGSGYYPIEIKFADIDIVKSLDEEGVLTYAQERLDRKQRATFYRAVELLVTNQIKIPRIELSQSIFNVRELEEKVNENGYKLVPGTNSVFYRENGGVTMLRSKKVSYSLLKSDLESYLKLTDEGLKRN
jgi:hypothetical protein